MYKLMYYYSENAVGKRLRRLGYPVRRGRTVHTRNEVKAAIEVMV
jgi:hypothetical protein